MENLPSHQLQRSSARKYGSIMMILPIALVIALTLGLLGVSDGQAITLESKQSTRIDEPNAVLSDTLYVGLDVPYWPYEYYSGAQIIGHDINLMNALATELGVTVEYIVVPWSTIFDGLINDDYDAVISALSVMPERESIIDYSLPYETYFSPSWSGDLAIAVRQEDDLLRNQINEALLKVRANGTLATIINETNVDLSSAYPDTWATLPDWPVVPTDIETTLVYPDPQGTETIIQVPIGAVSGEIILTYNPLDTDIISSSFSTAGHVFDLDAFEGGNYLPQGYQFNIPIIITLHYTDTDVMGLDENTLQLLFWEVSTVSWIDAACGDYDRHPEDNWLAVPICHLSQFALMGEIAPIYLPIILSNK
jgi:hypothetical protein